MPRNPSNTATAAVSNPRGITKVTILKSKGLFRCYDVSGGGLFVHLLCRLRQVDRSFKPLAGCVMDSFGEIIFDGTTHYRMRDASLTNPESFLSSARHIVAAIAPVSAPPRTSDR